MNAVPHRLNNKCDESQAAQLELGRSVVRSSKALVYVRTITTRYRQAFQLIASVPLLLLFRFIIYKVV